MKFQLNRSGIKAYKKVLQKRLMNIQKEGISFLWKQLYNQTPRDTGAAAASWTITVNNPIYHFDKNKTSATLSIPQFTINDTLIISTGCPYMSVLNDGNSDQAPQNFIQLAVAATVRYVNILKLQDIE